MGWPVVCDCGTLLMKKSMLVRPGNVAFPGRTDILLFIRRVHCFMYRLTVFLIENSFYIEDLA